MSDDNRTASNEAAELRRTINGLLDYCGNVRVLEVIKSILLRNW